MYVCIYVCMYVCMYVCSSYPCESLLSNDWTYLFEKEVKRGET